MGWSEQYWEDVKDELQRAENGPAPSVGGLLEEPHPGQPADEKALSDEPRGGCPGERPHGSQSDERQPVVLRPTALQRLASQSTRLQPDILADGFVTPAAPPAKG
jgi:hypothetical protein